MGITATEPERDWSRLPPELVVSISQNLSIFADYASFRAVCASWRSTTKPIRLPWLMVPRNPPGARYSDYGGEGIRDDFRRFFAWIGDSDARQFFSLPDMKNHLLCLPEARRKRFYGVGHGWLLVTGCPVMFLLNPFTRDRVHLPSITDFPSPDLIISFAGLSSERGYSYSLNNLDRGKILLRKVRNSFVAQAVVSADPATSARFAVMVSIEDHRKLGYCWAGDPEWKVVDVRFNGGGASVAHFDGRFYAVDFGVGKVVAVDVRVSPAKVTVLPSVGQLQYDQYYLLESAGKLLFVGRYQERTVGQRTGVQFKDYFQIFELDASGKKPKWLRIQGIGDRALFLSGTNSLSVNATDFPGFCKPNCIYFADFYDPRKPHENGTKGHAVGVYRIGDESLDVISTYSNGLCLWHKTAWVLPSLY